MFEYLGGGGAVQVKHVGTLFKHSMTTIVRVLWPVSLYHDAQRRHQENSSGGQALALGADLAPSLPISFLPSPIPPLPFPPLPFTPLSPLPSPLEVGPRSPSQQTILPHFSLKILHLVATLLIIFSIVKRLLRRARYYSGREAPWRRRCDDASDNEQLK